MSTAKRATSRSARTKASTSTSSTRRAKIKRRVKTYSMSSLPGALDSEENADIRSASLDDIDQMARRGELAATRRDAEEIELDESFWRNARVIMPNAVGKTSVHLRIDRPVLDWFKDQGKGKGHLTRMNAVLRAYYEAHRGRGRKQRARRD